MEFAVMSFIYQWFKAGGQSALNGLGNWGVYRMDVHRTEAGVVEFYLAFAKSAGMACPVKDWTTANGQGKAWVRQVDSVTSPTQLRHFLQNENTVCSEPTLRALGQHYRGHQPAAADKLFITVAEYLYRFAPDGFSVQSIIPLAHVAEILEPILGEADDLPDWLPELEELAHELFACEHLHDLARTGLFDRGRKLKARVSAGGLDTMGFVAFARFNFLLRRAFTTLWEAEVWWIEQALNELESRAEFFVDCSEIGLSPIVPTNEVFHMVCQWKQPSFSDYAQDQTYQKVQKVRQILETALLPEMA
jgi:hypothetical protein